MVYTFFYFPLNAAHVTVEEETPAQAEARVNASKKIKEERFSRLWDWAKEAFMKAN